jgi:hypothetical protein
MWRFIAYKQSPKPVLPFAPVVPARATNSDSTATRRNDRGVFDRNVRPLRQAVLSVVALATGDDARSQLPRSHTGSIFIASPPARYARLSPRIALY